MVHEQLLALPFARDAICIEFKCVLYFSVAANALK
jgi:hypothetical protein